MASKTTVYQTGFDAGAKWAREMIDQKIDADIFAGAADISDAALNEIEKRSPNMPRHQIKDFTSGFEHGALKVSANE